MTVRYRGFRPAEGPPLVVCHDDVSERAHELDDVRDADLMAQNPIAWGPASSLAARRGLALAILADARLPWQDAHDLVEEVARKAETFRDSWELERDDLRRALTRRFLARALAIAAAHGVRPEDL